MNLKQMYRQPQVFNIYEGGEVSPSFLIGSFEIVGLYHGAHKLLPSLPTPGPGCDEQLEAVLDALRDLTYYTERWEGNFISCRPDRYFGKRFFPQEDFTAVFPELWTYLKQDNPRAGPFVACPVSEKVSI